MPLPGKRASTGTTAVNFPWSRPREHEAVRLAILDAARRLADRHELSELTLSAVANEAGIGRTTIYGYFTSKRELLWQLAGNAPSEQVQKVADVPSVVEMPAQTAFVEIIPKPAHADVASGSGPAQANEKVISENKNSGASDDAGDHGEKMRLQAEELDRLAKRIIIPKASAMREGTDVVISRLETRVKVIEQSVASFDLKQARDTKELTGKIDAAVAAAQQLQKRLETIDNKQQYALAELRLDIHNLANVKNPEAAQSVPLPDEGIAEQAFVPTAQAPIPSEPPGTSSETQSPSYLSAARRAAMDAAQKKAADERDRTAWRRSSQRRQLALLALIAASLTVTLLMRIEGVPRAKANAVSVPRELADRALSRRADGAGDPKVSLPNTLAALAASGNTQAQLVLGLKLFNGDGVAIDIERGANLLKRAAASGQPVAQNFLAMLFQTGTGVSTDMAQAVRWFQAAAQQGNVKAMTDLAKAYAGGWKEGIDFAAAARWFAQAASYGDVDAQFDLAVLFERGNGVPSSILDAYTWYSIAAAEGDKTAAERAKVLASELSAEELRAANETAARFKPLIPKPAANEVPSASTLLVPLKDASRAKSR